MKKVFLLATPLVLILSFQNCSKGYNSNNSLMSANAMLPVQKRVGAKISSMSHSFSGGSLQFKQTAPSNAEWILINWTCSSNSSQVSLGVSMLDSKSAVILSEPICNIASLTNLKSITGTTMMPIPAGTKNVQFVSGYAANGQSFPSVNATFYAADLNDFLGPGPRLASLSYDSATAVVPAVPIVLPADVHWLYIQSTCVGQSTSISIFDMNNVNLMDYVVCTPGDPAMGHGTVTVPVPFGAASLTITDTAVASTVTPPPATPVTPRTVFMSNSGAYGSGNFSVPTPVSKASDFTRIFPSSGIAVFDLSIPTGTTWIGGWAACTNNQTNSNQTLTAVFEDANGSAISGFEACNFVTTGAYGAAYAPFQMPVPPNAKRINFATGDTTGSTINVTLTGYFWQ